VNTEAVAYVSGRSDPLALLFILASIYLFLSKEKRYFFLSLAFFVFALLSRETAIVQPILALIAFFSLEKNLSRNRFFAGIKKIAPFLAIAFVYILLRLTALNFENTLNFYNTQNIYTQSLFVRLNTFFNLLPNYFSLLIFPTTLIYDRQVLISPNISVVSALSFVLILAIFAIALVFRKRTNLFLFSFLWFFVAFLPTSGIIPINGIFFEHFLYIPSIGFYLILAFLISCFLYSSFPRAGKVLVIFLFLAYILFLSLKTIERNAQWHDPIRFYTETLKYTENARLHNNLGMAYAENNMYKEAITEYKKAIKIGDFYPQTHYNLANVLVMIGKTQEAEQEYKKAIDMDKNFYPAYIRLYEIYRERDDNSGLYWLRKKVDSSGNKNILPSF
jgi:tetratricopeptide (TPR) repeat protein